MRTTILLGMALAIVTLTVYWQVENHDFMVLDDLGYVVENAKLLGGLTAGSIGWAFTAVELGNWHPVTWLSHLLDVQLYGLNPRGHHLSSVLIHTVSSLLLFFLLLRLTKAPWRSAFVAALFALHPLHVESVAWISERKDVLSGLFCWLTLLVYAEYVKTHQRKWYILTLIVFTLGLMSKPMLVTLPVIMLLLDFWPLRRLQYSCDRLWQPSLPGNPIGWVPLLKEKIPFFALSLASSLVTVYAQSLGGAIAEIDVFPLEHRLANAAIAYPKYLGKMLWPVDLAVFYPFPFSIPLWQVVGAFGLLLAITVGVVRFGGRQPYLVTGWFWFLVSLLPVIGIIQVGIQSMADRYSYIPLVGIFLVVAWGSTALTGKIRCQTAILGLLAGAIILAAGSLTWQQLRYWQTSETLLQHTLKVTPGNFYVHYLLGIDYARRGRVTEAVGQYQQAIRINPHHVDLYYHLGIAYGMEEKFDLAIEQFRTIIRKDPAYVSAYNLLGVTLAQKGLFGEAIGEFRKALALDPGYSQARHNLALALERQNNPGDHR